MATRKNEPRPSFYCNYGNKDRLIVQQASKLQNVEIPSFVKELLLFSSSSLHHEKKRK
jgi:hypothetical protein